MQPGWHHRWWRGRVGISVLLALILLVNQTIASPLADWSTMHADCLEHAAVITLSSSVVSHQPPSPRTNSGDVLAPSCCTLTPCVTLSSWVTARAEPVDFVLPQRASYHSGIIATPDGACVTPALPPPRTLV